MTTVDSQAVRPRSMRRNCLNRDTPAPVLVRCQVSRGARARRRKCLVRLPVAAFR